MTGPQVFVLAGGELLVRGPAVARIEQAVRHALAAARRDGIVPPDVPGLADALRVAVERQQAAGCGVETAKPLVAEFEPSSTQHDEVEVADVARIGQVSEQYARRLCRGTFTTARMDGRRWLVDRIEVQTWADQRAARKAS
ncbi:hypothetical protein O7600_20150 [Micromonospora sp. WMMA1998]|uniref:hypothetical protein n=1 Tax=Micromonospora sp. WMMA1998 TaxID=3015167 RepID=UPI00248C53AF|nr:hypothetical protein [Micromonospora sp. WMMA1998]WBC13444.1 hypothetical protein O7600_20150 [Micromonospora sp. WMMA1998]